MTFATRWRTFNAECCHRISALSIPPLRIPSPVDCQHCSNPRMAIAPSDGIKRRTFNGAPINGTDELPDGTQLDAVAGIRKMLVSHREEFASTFTEKLLTYALGREIEYFDVSAIRKITRDAAANQYRWSSIIEGIIRSVPVQLSITDSGPAQALVVSKR